MANEVKRLVEDQLPLFMLPERIFALERCPATNAARSTMTR